MRRPELVPFHRHGDSRLLKAERDRPSSAFTSDAQAPSTCASIHHRPAMRASNCRLAAAICTVPWRLCGRDVQDAEACPPATADDRPGLSGWLLDPQTASNATALTRLHDPEQHRLFEHPVICSARLDQTAVAAARERPAAGPPPSRAPRDRPRRRWQVDDGSFARVTARVKVTAYRRARVRRVHRRDLIQAAGGTDVAVVTSPATMAPSAETV
jgi:hypothetical protein